MREIVLDTETTGTDPAAGDRIIEIGCVELVKQFPTGRTFHAYVNPQRSVSHGAFNVHGLSEAFLADKPIFAAMTGPADAFLAPYSGISWIIRLEGAVCSPSSINSGTEP